MTLPQVKIIPQYHAITDDRYDETYIVDEQGRDVDPALLREETEEEE